MKSVITRWNEEPLYPKPFSPVQSALKFSKGKEVQILHHRILTIKYIYVIYLTILTDFHFRYIHSFLAKTSHSLVCKIFTDAGSVKKGLYYFIKTTSVILILI